MKDSVQGKTPASMAQHFLLRLVSLISGRRKEPLKLPLIESPVLCSVLMLKQASRNQETTRLHRQTKAWAGLHQHHLSSPTAALLTRG